MLSFLIPINSRPVGLFRSSCAIPAISYCLTPQTMTIYLPTYFATSELKKKKKWNMWNWFISKGIKCHVDIHCCQNKTGGFALEEMRMKQWKLAKGITAEVLDHLNVAATSVKINKVIKACGWKLKKRPQTALLLIIPCSLSSHMSFCGLLSGTRPG